MDQNSTFESFLKKFVKKLEVKEKQFNQASWILETTGSKDAADLVASLDNEYKVYFSDEKIYEKLILFNKEGINDYLLKRQYEILIKQFKANMLPKNLLKEISIKEADLYQTYANFRTQIDDQKVSENDIREILKNELSIDIRKKTWDASKEIGSILAPKIIELVKLRNIAAKHIGYDNFFDMKLDLDDINKDELFKTFGDLKKSTEDTYLKILNQINENLSKTYDIPINQLGPWAWKDPFCQMDPIESLELDKIFIDKDILSIAKSFYEKMGFNIDGLIENSDLYERDNKNQHAFCTAIDRDGDVRTLNNIKPNSRWMDTLLHEFGHGVYDLSVDMNLPWLLRQHPHILMTEAIALLMGRQVYTKEFLQDFCSIDDEKLFSEIIEGHKRRQIIFSRSVFLITNFEKEMYENPDQDLNDLWWSLFEKFYHCPRPKNRENNCDWAAKFHIGLAPVYYHDYLLGEVFASALQKELLNITKNGRVWEKSAAKFLVDEMFSLGSIYRWDNLIERVLKKRFSSDAWIEECNK